MKVICVNASKSNDYVIKASKALIEGNVYTVVRECMGKNRFGNFIPAYEILEYGNEGVWERFRFIPLSTIDETELLQERQKQLA